MIRRDFLSKTITAAYTAFASGYLVAKENKTFDHDKENHYDQFYGVVDFTNYKNSKIIKLSLNKIGDQSTFTYDFKYKRLLHDASDTLIPLSARLKKNDQSKFFRQCLKQYNDKFVLTFYKIITPHGTALFCVARNK